jgi:protein-tyrosine phosphatase
VTETLTLPWISIGNAVNLRDTGGLACRDGATTRHRALLRSGTLRQLTAGDAVTLIEVCGVRTVLDLRTARELASEGPSALARAGLATVHLPLIRDDQLALPEAEDQADVTAALRRAYQSYLDDRGHHIATAARLVAASAGATLVHCAAGKDRTGVTVALLLASSSRSWPPWGPCMGMWTRSSERICLHTSPGPPR